MRHFVLTRSAYGPEWGIEANARRLTMTSIVTARLMAAQTFRDWTWLVLIHAADPFAPQRRKAFESAGVSVRFIVWQPEEYLAMEWDRRAPTNRRAEPAQRRKAAAATAYRAPWAEAIGPRDEAILMTRIDDDDGFAPDALDRIQRAAGGKTRRALLFPEGIRVWHGRQAVARHETNAMATLQTPAGDEMTVYDYGHRFVNKVAPVTFIDEDPGWLWVRHRDTISGWRRAQEPITAETKILFPIDWRALRLVG